MGRFPRLLPVLLAPLLVLGSCAASGPPPAEPLAQPFRVLLLGDSISIGYTGHVQEVLEGRAVVVRPTHAQGNPENCAGTNKGVVELDRWLALDGGGWDVIHFNFGLHDLKRVHPESGKNSTDPDDPHQADPQRYGAQLRDIAERLGATGARLVFATTTPVPEGGVRPHREPVDAIRYNEVAVDVMGDLGIPVNDLYAFALPRLEEIQRPRDVHFTQDGSRVLAARVVEAILAAAGHAAP